MGILPVHYYDMTMAEVMMARKGYYDKVRYQRLSMFIMLRMWGDPKKVPGTPEEFWPLPFDPEPETITTDDFEAIKEEWRKQGFNV